MPRTQINLEGWQDYRGVNAGALLYVETSHQSSVPVRDQMNENGKGFFFEPNYETSTYGLVSCCNAKSINAIVHGKSKSRYILFGTFLPFTLMSLWTYIFHSTFYLSSDLLHLQLTYSILVLL